MYHSFHFFRSFNIHETESFEAAVTRSSDHDSWIGELNFDIALNIEAAFELNLSANWAKAIYWFL